jgi:hypothetical protein
MSEIQFVYGSWPGWQRLAAAERFLYEATDPEEFQYWGGFIVGVCHRMAGQDIYGGGVTFEYSRPARNAGIEDGWRGLNPKAGSSPWNRIEKPSKN